MANFSKPYTERDVINIGELYRLFTNRKDFINVFEEKLRQPSPIPVLMFYGVGGSGKTWMIYYLRENSCKSNNCPHAYINFRYDDVDPVNCLKKIRDQLLNTNSHFQFPRFDIIWSFYWQRTHDGLSISQSSLLSQKDRNTMEIILQVIGNIPIAGGIAATAIKLGNQFAGWAKDQYKAQKVLSWLQEHTSGDCYGALDHKIHLFQFPKLLALALAADLTDSSVHLKNKPIIFIDTYEYLEDKLKLNDKSVIEIFAEELQSLETNALLLISGQNRLRWAERLKNDHWESDEQSVWFQEVSIDNHTKFIGRNLEQYSLAPLSEADAYSYLSNKRKIESKSLIQQIYQLTGGYALALGTAADLLEDAADWKASAKIEVLGNYPLEITEDSDRREILNRILLESLLGQLAEQGKEDIVGILRAASTLRWFTKNLLLFVIGYIDPTFQDKFKRIIRYSFIEPNGVVGGEWSYRIHPTMMELLNQGIADLNQKKFWHEKAYQYCTNNVKVLGLPETEGDIEIKFLYELEQIFHFLEVDEIEAVNLLEGYFKDYQMSFRWDNCSRLADCLQSKANLGLRAESYKLFFEGELLMNYLLVNVINSDESIESIDLESDNAKIKINRKLAIDIYRRCIEFQKKSDDYTLIPLCLLREGELLNLEHNGALAVSKFEEALQISEEKNLKYQLAQALRYLATFEYANNSYYDKSEYLEKSLNIFREIGDNFWIAELLKGLAIIYARKEKFSEAISISEEALTLAKLTKKENAISRAKHSLARAYYYSEQFDQSLELFLDVIEDFKKLGDLGGVASCKRSVGRILRDRNLPNYSDSLKYLENALRIDEKLESDWGVARNQYEIALLYDLQGKKEDALRLARAAQSRWKTIEHIDIQLANKLLSKLGDVTE